jgi:PhnB protein
MTFTTNINLSFNGQCEEAFTLYAECFGGRIVSLFTYGGSPMANQAPPEWAGKVMHATVAIGDGVLTGADVPPPTYAEPQGFEIMVGTSDLEFVERVFDTLAANGTVRFPLQQTFWAVRFGVVVDRFGIPWSINCEEATV